MIMRNIHPNVNNATQPSELTRTKSAQPRPTSAALAATARNIAARSPAQPIRASIQSELADAALGPERNIAARLPARPIRTKNTQASTDIALVTEPRSLIQQAKTKTRGSVSTFSFIYNNRSQPPKTTNKRMDKKPKFPPKYGEEEYEHLCNPRYKAPKKEADSVRKLIAMLNCDSAPPIAEFKNLLSKITILKLQGVLPNLDNKNKRKFKNKRRIFLRFIQALKENTTVKFLDLSHNTLGCYSPKTIKKIFEAIGEMLKKNNHLTYLRLSQNKFAKKHQKTHNNKCCQLCNELLTNFFRKFTGNNRSLRILDLAPNMLCENAVSKNHLKNSTFALLYSRSCRSEDIMQRMAHINQGVPRRRMHNNAISIALYALCCSRYLSRHVPYEIANHIYTFFSHSSLDHRERIRILHEHYEKADAYLDKFPRPRK